jgi:hypothetical protein
MLKPITIENGIPVFMKNDIDIYGLPDLFGWTQW